LRMEYCECPYNELNLCFFEVKTFIGFKGEGRKEIDLTKLQKEICEKLIKLGYEVYIVLVTLRSINGEADVEIIPYR